MARRSAFAGAVALACTLALVAPTAPAGAAASQLQPPSGALLGVYVQPSAGWTQAEVKADITALETSIGRKLDIDHHYYQWGKTFPTWQETWDLANGRIPLLSWNGTSTADINAGMHDAYFRARADAVKALGQRVLIRWFYEMDTQKLSTNAGPPAQYIAAWRRIHGIFAERGATNVEWVWCPTASAFHTGEAQTYYPGDAYVDWIAADGYNWAPGKPNSQWRTIGSIFGSFYNWAKSTGKPLMIAESGTEERNPGEKAHWLRDVPVTLRTQFPAIKAFLYFDSRTTDFYDQIFDWRVDSTAGTLQAFKDMATDPYLSPGTLTQVGVTRAGEGAGAVTSTPTGINCGTTCSSVFTQGSPVTLTAAPTSSSTFTGWSGACSGASPTCVLTPQEAASATATFGIKRHELTVARTGTGGGTVSVAPGINCGSDCGETYNAGTEVRLVAAPNASSAFAGWTGPCSGSGLECVVTMDGPAAVTAIFEDVPVGSQALTIVRTGDADGQVVAEPGTVQCAMTCVLPYLPDETVMLEASPGEGARFGGWSGDCAGTDPTCTLSMSGSKVVSAVFASQESPEPVHQPSAELEAKASSRRQQRFAVEIANRGNVADTYVVEAPGRSRRFRVRYVANGMDVTGPATSGGYLIEGLQPGATTMLEVMVKAKRRAPRRATFPVMVSSTTNPDASAALTLSVRRPRKR